MEPLKPTNYWSRSLKPKPLGTLIIAHGQSSLGFVLRQAPVTVGLTCSWSKGPESLATNPSALRGHVPRALKGSEDLYMQHGNSSYRYNQLLYGADDLTSSVPRSLKRDTAALRTLQPLSPKTTRAPSIRSRRRLVAKLGHLPRQVLVL